MSIELRFGSTYRDTYEQIAYAQALARHPDVDIALIKLLTTIKTTSFVQPASLPRYSQRQETFANQMATICGMGVENQKTYEISYYLKYTDLTIMAQADCRPYFGDIDTRVLCAKSSVSYASTCPGELNEFQ